MSNLAKLAVAAILLIAAGAIGFALAGSRPPVPVPSPVPALLDIVVTEANVPSGLTVHRTVRGVEALRTSKVVPEDVVGFVDAMETSFDGDEHHQGDHEDLYTTFGAVFESVADADRAFDAAVVLHEAGDGWGLAAGKAPIKRDAVPGLGDASVHYTQGSDYGYPEISVYLWRVDNVLLHAVDYHPYDRSDLLESIVRAMDARAEGSLEGVGG